MLGRYYEWLGALLLLPLPRAPGLAGTGHRERLARPLTA